MLINHSSICKFNLHKTRQDFSILQLPLGVRHLQKIILGMASFLKLGTKNQSLQYRVNASLAKIQRKKNRKKRQRRREEAKHQHTN